MNDFLNLTTALVIGLIFGYHLRTIWAGPFYEYQRFKDNLKSALDSFVDDSSWIGNIEPSEINKIRSNAIIGAVLKEQKTVLTTKELEILETRLRLTEDYANLLGAHVLAYINTR